MWSLRTLIPRRSRWRVAQFDTLRLRLLKLAVRIEVLKTQARLDPWTCYRRRVTGHCSPCC
jgi:hypothetical protein